MMRAGAAFGSEPKRFEPPSSKGTSSAVTPTHRSSGKKRTSASEHTIPRTSTQSWDARHLHEDPEATILNRLLSCVDSWTAQALYLVVTLVHSSTYYFSWEDFRHGETVTLFGSETTLDTREVEYIFTSGAILFFMTACELIIRISAQGGSTLWRWAPWRKFFRLKFHQIEALILFAMTFRSMQTTYLFAIWVLGDEEATETINATEDQVTVSILLFYRFFRAWGIWFNITVEAEKQRAHKRKKNRLLWYREHILRVDGRKQECMQRAERLFNSLVFQAWVIILVFVHFFLYSIERRFLQGSYWILTGYFLGVLYSIEFLFRCVAQGNIEQFLMPCLHKFDFLLLALGLLLLGYTTVYHYKFQESRKLFEPLGVWSVLLLLLQRAVRVFEVWQDISALDTNSLTINVAMNKFLARFGDVLRIPKQNVQSNLSKIIGKTQAVTFTIHKAELDPNAFKGLHLPITIRAGLMEELVFTHKPFEGFTQVKIENALLMLGPGGGLAEAGGFEPAGTYWDADTVSEAKSKLVELICAHLTPPRPSRAQGTQGRSPGGAAPNRAELPHDDSLRRAGTSKGLKSSRPRIRQRAKNYVYDQYVQLKQKYTDLMNLMKDMLLKRVEVQIKNVRVQYDDADGVLCSEHVVIGAKLGSISGRWEKGKEFVGDVCRLGVYCERRPTRDSSSFAGSYGSVSSARTGTPLASTFLQTIRSSLVRRTSMLSMARPSSRWAGSATEQSATSSRSSDLSPAHRARRKGATAASTFDSGSTMVRRTTTMMTQASTRVRNATTRWGITSGESRQAAKEAWRRDLYSRVLDAPKEAIRELVRMNWVEYLQLWVLEYVEQELKSEGKGFKSEGKELKSEGKEPHNDSDRRRHCRRELFLNHNNVFMLMKLELRMGPDGDASEEAQGAPGFRESWSRRTSGKRDSFSSARELAGDKEDRCVGVNLQDEPSKVWRWQINVPYPTRVIVSEEQTRCMRTLMLCVKGWLLHDQAFRWHPDLELRNPNVQLYEESGLGRKTLVRMWWIYAVHRVLARLQRRPISTTIQLLWRANNFRRYKALVRSLAKRTTAKGATATASEKSLQPNKWEVELLRCYQMHLDVPDIVMIRRQGLAIIAGKDVVSLGSGGSKGSLASSGGRPAFTASNTREALATIEATEEEEVEAPPSEGYLSRASTNKNLGGSGSHPLTKADSSVQSPRQDSPEPRQQVELPDEPIIRRADSSRSGLSSEATTPQAEDLLVDGPLAMIAGHWELTCVGGEVLFLSGISRPRKRAIHAKMTGLLFDMNVVITPFDDRKLPTSPSTSSNAGLAPLLTGLSVSATFTVDDFTVTSPDDRALLLGGLPDIVQVVQPVKLAAPSKSGLLAGRRVDQPVVFAMRGRGQGRKRGVCEVHVPDLQVVLYEPLILLLLSYVKCEKPSFDRPSVDRRWDRSDRQLYAKWAARLSGQPRNTVVERRAPIPLGGRSSLHLPEQDAVLVAAARTELHTHADRISRAAQLLKQVHSNQVLFEKIAGALGLDLEADFHLHVGAVQCMEVLAYTDDTVVVVQGRLWPFYANAATSEAERQAGFEDASGKAKGRSDVLARWRRNLNISGNGFQEAQVAPWEEDDPAPVQPPPATVMAPARTTLYSWTSVMANLGDAPDSGGSPGWWSQCACNTRGEQEVESVEPVQLERGLFSRRPQDIRRARGRRGTSSPRPDVMEELNKTAACDIQISVLTPETISDSVCWLSLQAKEFHKQLAEARAVMLDDTVDESKPGAQ